MKIDFLFGVGEKEVTAQANFCPVHFIIPNSDIYVPTMDINADPWKPFITTRDTRGGFLPELFTAGLVPFRGSIMWNSWWTHSNSLWVSAEDFVGVQKWEHSSFLLVLRGLCCLHCNLDMWCLTFLLIAPPPPPGCVRRTNYAFLCVSSSFNAIRQQVYVACACFFLILFIHGLNTQPGVPMKHWRACSVSAAAAGGWIRTSNPVPATNKNICCATSLLISLIFNRQKGFFFKWAEV